MTREDLFGLVEAAPPTPGEPGFATFRLTRRTDAATFARALVPSRPQVARIFNEALLRAPDGHVLTRTESLVVASELTLALPPAEPGPTSDAPVRVLFEDPFLLAAEKPAGILVHGDGSAAETLAARVQGYLLREGVAARPQPLHRLDVETSGIVLFSLVAVLQPCFDALFAGDAEAGRPTRKRYFAVVEGRLPWDDAAWHTVEAPIARDRHDARRMRVGRTGKPAVTRLRTLEVRGARSLVEAELATGRRHQIRVHLAHLGCPISGDELYGGRALREASAATSHDAGRAAPGLLLHAHELRFVHPLTCEPTELTSPLPERFGWTSA